MRELSKDTKTHVILTFAGTKHHITSEQNEKLKFVGEKDFFQVDGTMLKMSTVSAIMPIEEYYLSKPDERPAPKLPEFVAPPVEAVPLDRQAERSEKALRGMLAGIAHYIENHGTNPVIDSEFAKRKTKYKSLYGREFEYGERDRERVLDSLSEQSGGLPKVPCRPCLKEYRHSPPKRTEDESLGTVEQFT